MNPDKPVKPHVEFTRDVHTRLKDYCLQQGKTINQVVNEQIQPIIGQKKTQTADIPKVFWCYNNDITIPEGSTCCYHHFKGLFEKNGVKRELFAYQIRIFDDFLKYKRIWIKKPRGIGATMLFIRIISFLCDTLWNGGTVIIITGTGQDLATDFIRRFKHDNNDAIIPDTKEAIAIYNGVRIEAFPGGNVKKTRGRTDVRLYLVDEGDMFEPSQQQECRSCAEGYLGKGTDFISLMSTAWVPGGLWQQIEREPNSLYHKINMTLDDIGENTIFSRQEIELVRKSPSFMREFYGQYGIGIGNLWPVELLDGVIEEYDLSLKDGQKVITVDPAYGESSKSSKFAICAAEKLDGIIYLKHSQEYARASPSAMVDVLEILWKKYGNCTVLVDGSQSGLIRDLVERGINAVGVVFNQELSKMTMESVMAVKERRIRLHKTMRDLQDQLISAQSNSKGHPDKTVLRFDLGDCFMMICNYFKTSGGYGVVVTPGELADNIPQRSEETQVIHRVIELSVSPSGHKRNKIPLQLEDDD